MILASTRNPEGRMKKCDLERRVYLSMVERDQENKHEYDVPQKETFEKNFSVVL